MRCCRGCAARKTRSWAMIIPPDSAAVIPAAIMTLYVVPTLIDPSLRWIDTHHYLDDRCSADPRCCHDTGTRV